MSLVVTQQPITPNAAYTRLPYTVTNPASSSLPQYQYVVDIYESGSTDRIVRLTQTPNPSGVATFDPSRIFQGELQYDNNWEVQGSTQPVNAVKTFLLSFGEQYGTSTSSSVSVYTDITTRQTQIFPAVVDPNNGSSYDFPTASFLGGGNSYLTNCPSAQTTDGFPSTTNKPYLINSTDYFTLTTFVEDIGTSGSIRVRGVKCENGVSTLVTELNVTSSNALGQFTTWGIGAQNLSDYDSFWSSSIANGDINGITTFNDPGGVVIYLNDKWDGIPVTSGTQNFVNAPSPLKECSDEYTRFAFINKYGFWDYYNVYNPVRRASNIQRENVTLPQIDYSSISSPYNVSNRGEKDYYTDAVDVFEITTEYIDKKTANWLEELLESPSVFIQKGKGFIPVVVNNNSFLHNNDTARNKLFEYTIQFEPANQPFGDWEFELPETPPAATTDFRLVVDSDIVSTEVKLGITDPYPQGTYDLLATIGPIASGSATSGDINSPVVSDVAKLTTSVTGSQVTTGSCQVTNEIYLDNILVSNTSITTSYPFSQSFDYVGNLETPSHISSSVIVRNIPIPPPVVYSYNIVSPSDTDENYKPCGVNTGVFNQTIYSEVSGALALITGSTVVYSDSNLTTPFNGFNQWWGIDVNNSAPQGAGYADFSFQINLSGSVSGYHNCADEIYYKVHNCWGTAMEAMGPVTSSVSLSNDDRLYYWSEEGNQQSWYVINGFTSSYASEADTGGPGFVSYNGFDGGNPLTFCPSGSSETLVFGINTGSLTNTTVELSGSVFDEGNWGGDGPGTSPNDQKLTYEELHVYIQEGDFPNYNPLTNGSLYFATKAYPLNPAPYSGSITAGSRGNFNHLFTSLDPGTTYSVAAIGVSIDYRTLTFLRDVSNAIVFTTPV